MSVTRFFNCKILRGEKFIEQELWVQSGRFLDPQIQFFSVRKRADVEIDCQGLCIAPGYVEMQLNGGFGIDFTSILSDFPELASKTNDSTQSDGETVDGVVAKVQEVGRGILAHGVTSFCPTLITSSSETYQHLIPRIPRWQGSKSKGATNLGLHLEGPFINRIKAGAHPVALIRDSATVEEVRACYGRLDNAALVTIAPELPGAEESIKHLVSVGKIVSMGHSCAHISDGEKGMLSGAVCITHLFNAMNAFHHRDPCLVGLLAVDLVVQHKYPLFYGLIADGIHTHSSALRIAYSSHPNGSVLVTDAIGAMGLPDGHYHIGSVPVTVSDHRATVSGTDTLAGSVATMDQCVKNFAKIAGNCAAILAATLHPSQALGVIDRKGTLDVGKDADFIIVNDNLDVFATFIAGKLVFSNPHCPLDLVSLV